MKDMLKYRRYRMIVVDTMNLAARSYYGMKDLTHEGHRTGMLYGVAKFLLSAKKLHPESRIIFLWEGTSSRRQTISSEYKRSRKPKEDAFITCVKELHEFLNCAGVEQMSHIGLEADDVAGWVCDESSTETILLVSTDEDWLQYLKPDQIDLQRRDTVETFDDIHASLGFPPNKMGMWKILKGDRSDDIAGISRFPSAVARLLVNKCETYKEFKNYPLAQHNESWSKWSDQIQENWDTVIEPNAELILYNPEWIEDSQIVHVPVLLDKKHMKKMLAARGINSLISEVV